MRFLIDTNILIPLEPALVPDLEVNTPLAMDFSQLAQRSGCNICVHPAVEYDFGRDQNQERVTIRRQVLGRYHLLERPPSSDALEPLHVGRPVHGSNNWVDNELLAGVVGNAVNYLVTEDERIHRKSIRLGIASRVLHLSDAILLIKELFDEVPPPPPAVRDVLAYELDESDPIFASLRADYDGFDEWLTRCKQEHRQVYIVEKDHEPGLAALCILKMEDSAPDERLGKTLKLCTFKVSEECAGYKYGELLLKAVFTYAGANDYEHIYFTAFPKQVRLITFAQDFGFQFYRISNSREVALVKSLRPSADDSERLQPFDLHRKYGPHVTSFRGNNSFIVPIRPNYHTILFPEQEQQLDLFPGRHPCGNAIKKAYLCHARINRLNRGDNLFFYRSRDLKGLTALGICEGTHRYEDPMKIAEYVGKTTVYTYQEIQEMCSQPVLAIRFRLVRILDVAVTLDEMRVSGVLAGAPQSISQLSSRAVDWLRGRIDL